MTVISHACPRCRLAAAPRRPALAPAPGSCRADARRFVLLATTPLWLARVGLYQYLALEVMIWMLFALGYNLLLGTAGLPSFGHGAFFGVGAYAFGLLQQRVFANLWFDLAGAVLVDRGARRRVVAAFISHQRGIYFALLTIAFGQVFWFVADQVAQRHRRRGRPAQHRAAGRSTSASPASTCAATRRCSTSASASSRSSSSPSGGW